MAAEATSSTRRDRAHTARRACRACLLYTGAVPTAACIHTSATRFAALTMLALAILFSSGCATTGSVDEETDPTVMDPVPEASEDADSSAETPPVAAEESKEQEGEVPLTIADAEPIDAPIPEVVVQSRVPQRHETIYDLVTEARNLLRDVELKYVLTGKGKRQALRGRPVAFALWSEAREEWTIAQLELPRPPIKWKPGRRPLPFRMATPGIEARHVKGTGAERLMFAFSKDGEPLKVYGRKFPVFDNNLVKRRRWKDVVATAKTIVYLPFTEDTFDPAFVSGGRDFLVKTASRALDELREANVPSAAFPGKLLADTIPLQVVTTLAVIEQTDDRDYREKEAVAFEEVLSQYGLKQEDAYRYSVSSAKALGPMQFTNRRGKGTYSIVVRRCRGANLDPVFESGATNLLNAMKAAICLLDIEISQMRPQIREAYRANSVVLGIFPVAAYNGGPRNVTKLYRVLQRMKVELHQLTRPNFELEDSSVKCPCVWQAVGDEVRPISIPRYNNENRWYIEKYQSIVSLFE